MGTHGGHASRRGRGFTVALALMLMAGLLVSALPGALMAATDADGTWGRVELPPPERPVELEASEVDETGIPTDATFRLVSHGPIPAGELVRGLVVEPDIDMAVELGADASVVGLRPEQPLEPGSPLYFSVTGEDGSRLGAWSFHVRTPVAVVETLPRHHRRNVPPNTGIELTFDRDGVLEPERAFSIEPPVKGRFERRGRVLSFVPQKPLREDTVYRVTLDAGVGTSDPRTRSTKATTIEFVVRRPKAARVQPAATFIGQVAEARPGEPAIVEAYARKKATRRVPVDIYRFGSTEAVEAALLGVRDGNRWPYRERAIETKGMRQLRSQTATLQPIDPRDPDRRALTLQRPLPAGWYVLAIPRVDGSGPGSQLILQVTDLSTYAHITTTSSLFWVNDVRTGKPVSGAEVSLVGGAMLGLTDGQGLLEITTPEALGPDVTAPLLGVRTEDAAVFVPFTGSPWSGPNIVSWGQDVEPHDLAWSFLYTDRSAYRSSDTINIWGMLRDRADGSVPDEVEVRLGVDWDEFDSDEPRPPSIATTTARPSANGIYSASLSFEELPLGSYLVETRVDDEPVGETWLEVVHIIKPSYRLDLATNRRAYLAGETVRVSATAVFFDGTSVPGAPLVVNSAGQWRDATTNTTGRAAARLKARARGDGGQIAHQQITVRPKRSEEGEISGGTGIVVLPGAHFLDARVTRGDGQIKVAGAVHTVDLERLERQIEKDIHRSLDPRGTPIPGATVTARVTETRWIRRQQGTTYDFITKKVVPRYRYIAKRRRFPVEELISGSDGSFALAAPALADRAYEVVLTTVDSSGRSTRLVREAWRPFPVERQTQANLSLVGSEEHEPRVSVADGEEVSVVLRTGTQPQPTGGPNRYLFLLGQVGLQAATVQRSPEHSFVFGPALAPMVSIGAVRFTGSGYVALPEGLSVDLDAETRRLDVALSPDRDRYAPGETVELAVATTRADGTGAPASVVVRAVDEKLYAMGLAWDSSPLETLYRPVWSGTIRTYATHLLPSGLPGGPDTGGGGYGDTALGGRTDFRDAVLFEQVETDVNGEALVRFDVSDDLTSWRVSATAVNDRLEAGEATTLVPVGLPFFVEPVTAREFVVGDTAKLRLRAYGPGLTAAEPVTFTVSAPTLGLEPTRVGGTAFKTVGMGLPPLIEGRHPIVIDGIAGADGDGFHDRLTVEIDVQRSRLDQGRTEYSALAEGQTVPGGSGLTTIVVTDAGRGRFYPDLASLTWSHGPRADEALAAVQARTLLERYFGEASVDAREGAFTSKHFQGRGGLIALLPYSSGSESLSVLVALATPDAVDRTALLEGFRNIEGRRNVSRERKLQAYVARAVLGDDVLDRLQRYIDDQRLGTYERLLLGIGLAAASDEAAALDLEQDLLAGYGQQLGPWVRLWDEGDERAAERSGELTALLSILAAAVGDDVVAAAADAYVAENPPPETLANLQQVAYISRLIEQAPSQPASFTWQIDGEPQQIDLGPGESHRLTITAAQREALRLSPVNGSLGVASSWREPLDPAAIAEDESMTVERTVSPDGLIRSSDLVEVTLKVDLGKAAVDDCYVVTEVAPSGIAPLRDATSWRQRGRKGDGSGGALLPWSVEGQRVTWCIWADHKKPVRTLRYQGRVVNPGSFVWEPAVVQSTRAPELIRLTDPGTLVLGSQVVDESADIEAPGG